MNQEKLSARYGTFNLNMEPSNTIDVTDKVAGFVKNDELIIPQNIDISKVFGKENSSTAEYLQITKNNRVHHILADHYTEDIRISLNNPNPLVRVVYYIYINPDANWMSIVSGQLLQFKSYGILEDADMHIHITCKISLLKEVEAFIAKICPQANLYNSQENLFEYPGIKLVYNLSKLYPEDLFIYFHSKGMSYNAHSRSMIDINLFTKTFESWRKQLQIFKDPKINKVGLFPAIGSNSDSEKPGNRGGWIWYNFWYARGSYLKECDEPIASSDRYYFESWLGTNKGKLLITNDCKNIYKAGNKVYFTPNEVSKQLDKITKQLYLTRKSKLSRAFSKIRNKIKGL